MKHLGEYVDIHCGGVDNIFPHHTLSLIHILKDVVEICKEKGCKSKVVIGGACITQSFADEIGADGYSKDAAECVKLVERLLNS